MKRIDENHSFNVNLATLIGHPMKAILLKEIYGWCLRNLQKEKNIHLGVPWSYDPAKSLAEKFCYMSERSINRWLKELEDDHWIVSTDHFNKIHFDRTKWRTIDFDRYDKAVLFEEKSKDKCLKWSSDLKEELEQLKASAKDVDTIGQNGGSDQPDCPIRKDNLANQIGQNGQAIPSLNNSFHPLSLERAREENEETSFKQQPELQLDWKPAANEIITDKDALIQIKDQSGYKDNIREFCKAYFLNLVAKGEWFRLTVPEDPGDKYKWRAKHIAGITSWIIRDKKFYPERNKRKDDTEKLAPYHKNMFDYSILEK